MELYLKISLWVFAIVALITLVGVLSYSFNEPYQNTYNGEWSTNPTQHWFEYLLTLITWFGSMVIVSINIATLCFLAKPNHPR